MEQPSDSEIEPQAARPPAPRPDYLQPATDAHEDAHDLWHEAAQAYHDPPKFRRHIEALVQALRNVSWRLQASKAELADFDTWYPTWQEYMRSDESMRWLNEARIDIVKRSGLQSESLARVRIIDSYLEPRTSLLSLPVRTATSEVVARAQVAIPAQIRRHVAIEVARRWVVPERVDRELLTVLAHCWHVLDALLLYAGEVAAGQFPGESPSEFASTVVKPVCMRFDPSLIPLTFEADTGDLFSYEETAVHRKIDGGQLAERYGEPVTPIVEGDQLVMFARWMHDTARQIFKADGVVLPIVFLRKPNKKWDEPIVLRAADKRDKFMMWHELGKKVLVGGHDAFVVNNEMWVAPPPPKILPYMEVSELPDRGEVVATWLETESGYRHLWSSEIGRLMDTYFLREAEETLDLDDTPGFSEPIRRAWRLRATSSGSRASSVASDAAEF